jgi:hypothetical protein
VSDARFGGSFGSGFGGVDPVACRGRPGSLDAAWECAHGRLPGNRSAACGCWVENRPRVAPRVDGWTERSVVATVAGVIAWLGRSPGREEWRREGYAPSTATVERACGSWPAAVAAAEALLAGSRRAAA